MSLEQKGFSVTYQNVIISLFTGLPRIMEGGNNILGLPETLIPHISKTHQMRLAGKMAGVPLLMTPWDVSSFK